MESNGLHEVHSRRRNRAAAPIGALVLVMAISGIIALIILGVRLTEQMFDNSSEKQKYEKIVQPVLMFDPPSFEDIKTLDKFTVLQSALWATMLGEKRETYTFDPQGNLIVPASDVDVSCAKLFGPDIVLEHQAFSSDFGMAYDYDITTKAYHIPVLSAAALYTPRVDEIKKTGDIRELLVGYIPPGTAWNTDITGKKTEPDPHKFMIYKLKKVDKYYQLIAIEDPPPEKQITLGSGNASSVVSAEIASVTENASSEDSGSEAAAPAMAKAAAGSSSGGEGGAGSESSSSDESSEDSSSGDESSSESGEDETSSDDADDSSSDGDSSKDESGDEQNESSSGE